MGVNKAESRKLLGVYSCLNYKFVSLCKNIIMSVINVFFQRLPFMKVATSNKVILMLSFNFYSRRPLSHHQAAQVSIQLHTVVLTNTTKKKTMQFIKISVFFLRV